MLDEQCFADASSAANALAASVAADLRGGVAARGRAVLVVSGGKSPLPFFGALRVMLLDWSKVSITLADERWVAPNDADSNERLLREHLLRDAAGAAQLVGLKNDASTPEAGLPSTWHALAVLDRPFDAVVLGMGGDGHTASLFPQMPGLREALDPNAAPGVVAGVAPTAPAARISLNLPALLQATRIYLPLQGAAKRAVYRSAREDGDATRHPVAALLAQTRVPVTVQLIDE